MVLFLGSKQRKFCSWVRLIATFAILVVPHAVTNNPTTTKMTTGEDNIAMMTVISDNSEFATSMNWVSNITTLVTETDFVTTTASSMTTPVNGDDSGPSMGEEETGDDGTRGGVVGGKIPIYLGGFFSLGGGWDGSGILPTIEMALEDVNKKADLLAEYDLRMVWNDTQCEAGLGTRVLFDQLHKEPQKIMILGPACSTATQAVAETAYYWNLVTMSYAAASSELSNREKYPFFYRTYMPDAMYNPARVRLISDAGWTRVATIHENHELFSLAINDMLTLLKAANITIISSESFSEDPRNQVENLKNQDARIIIGNMYENMARRVFCEAYKQGITGEGYVWFLIGWYTPNWYLVDDHTLTCTVAEMKAAVEGSLYIATESLQLSQSTEPSISGLTAETYLEKISERLQWPQYASYSLNDLAPFGYDATWAVALMLNRSVQVLKTKTFKDGSTRKLEDFNYDDQEMAQLFFDLLNETEFVGLTGPVSFSSGDRVGITQIEQLQPYCSENEVLVGSRCLVFSDVASDWSTANMSCANGTVLSSLYDESDIDAVNGILHGHWYVGLYRTPDGQLHSMGNDIIETDLQEVNERLITSSSTSTLSYACVVIDFSLNGRLVLVDCDNPYPYICEKTARYEELLLGLYDTAIDELNWHSELIWPGGEIPPDRTPVIEMVIMDVYMGIGYGLYITMSVLASVGIVIALFFLGFNIKYRKQRFVKLSSPNLNNLIILGSIMVYSWIFLYGLDKNTVDAGDSRLVCQVPVWIICLGFVVAFGAMFSKTWRVHRVATFKTPKRRIIRDHQLYVMVLVLVAVDFIILLVWQIVDPMVLTERMLYERDDPDQSNTRLRPFVEYCHSDYSSYWLGAIFCYKGLLLIFGSFLAWETRKVTIPALNDSKLIGISVYNVFILCAIGVGVSLALGNEPAARFIFIAIIDLFCTTIVLGVVFVPKIISVYKDPAGENATGKKRISNGLDTLDRSTASNLPSSPTGYDSRPTSSASGGADAAPKTPTSRSVVERAQQERIKELEGKVKEMRTMNTMMKDTGPNAFGLWCFGLSCGCSCTEGCFYTENEDWGGSKAKYSFRHEESSTSGCGSAVGEIYTGPPRRSRVFSDGALSTYSVGNQNNKQPETIGAGTQLESATVLEVTIESGIDSGSGAALRSGGVSNSGYIVDAGHADSSEEAGGGDAKSLSDQQNTNETTFISVERPRVGTDSTSVDMTSPKKEQDVVAPSYPEPSSQEDSHGPSAPAHSSDSSNPDQPSNHSSN